MKEVYLLEEIHHCGYMMERNIYDHIDYISEEFLIYDPEIDCYFKDDWAWGLKETDLGKITNNENFTFIGYL